jgi:hypothetical protein
MVADRRGIKEGHVVELISPVGRWPAGTVGTVVSDYGDVKLVEVGDEADMALDYLSAPELRLKLLDEQPPDSEPA